MLLCPLHLRMQCPESTCFCNKRGFMWVFVKAVAKHGALASLPAYPHRRYSRFPWWRERAFASSPHEAAPACGLPFPRPLLGPLSPRSPIHLLESLLHCFCAYHLGETVLKQLYTLRAVGRRAAALALSAVLAVTCVSLAPLGPASAQEESPDTASQSDAPEIKTVRVGWLLGNQGFQNGMPDEYMSGWGYEYLQTLSYYTPGWKYEYVPGTFPELIQKLKDGEIDLMPNISYTPERAEKLLFSSNPQGEEHYYIFAKPTNDALGAGDPAALNGMTIGVNPDVMQTEVGKQWIEAQGISCDYRYYSSGNALFDALSSGEVDAIIMNDTISSADAMPVFSVGESNYFFAVPKSRQDLMDDINTAISMLRSTNPRYNDEVKTRYSARNSGSSALNGLESAWLADHGNTITFGYLDNLLPFSNQGEDGQIEGSLSALVSTLEEQYGITVNAVPFESNEDLTNALRDGTVDVAMPINMDYWLAEQAGFIQSSAVSTTSLVAIYTGGNLDDALKNIAFHDRSLLDSSDLHVHYPEATITQYPDAHACIDAIKAGKATCMIMTVTGLDTLRNEVDLGNLVTAEMPKSIELACWLRQGDAQLLSIVNKGIVSAADDIAASAYSHYSYSDGQSEFAQFVEHNRVAILTGIGALLVGVIAILAWALHSAREAQRRAQEASAAKTAFLSRMSHDIRTPLNGILGLLELNGQHPDDAEANSQNREKAKVAANHLLTLINDILEMSKIEDHAVELENLPFNLTDLCRDIFVLGQIRAKSRDVTLTTSGPDTFAYPDVYGSPLHVRRVFLNLVENCIKYNKPGGSVHYSAEQIDLVGDKVVYRFVISDTGIGMSPEFLKHLFEPFAQANNDARSNYQGTGMGMPIVKALLKSMGGTISVKSELGRGTTFTVDLPFAINRTPEEAVEASGDAEECDICGMSILLVEDNELNTEIAQTLLEHDGALVTTAANGKEALELFQAKPAGAFDAILMDVMMPKMNGYEATRAIRLCDKPDADEVPIIAMTANAFIEDIARAKESGMNDHLSKPIEIEKLKETLAKYRVR